MRAWDSVNAVALSFVEMAYGECLTLLGRFDEADAVLLAAAERRLALQGPEHPSTLEAEMLIARLRAAQGRGAEAGEIARRILEVRTRRLGACEATDETTAFLATLPPS
jgi:hypothetical protein